MKVLDQNGITHLYKQLSLQDYSNNETLINIINAIDARLTEIESKIKTLKSETITMTVALTAGAAGETQSFNFFPTYCNQNNYAFKQLVRAWPMSNWDNGAIVSIAEDSSWNNIKLTTNSSQKYVILIRFYYWE